MAKPRSSRRAAPSPHPRPDAPRPAAARHPGGQRPGAAPAAGLRRAAPAALRPQTRRSLWLLFAAALLLSLLADFFIHPKAHFGIDGSFGFFAWFGFLACLVLIVLGKIVGVFVRREADYYLAGDIAAAPAAPPDAAAEGRKVRP